MIYCNRFIHRSSKFIDRIPDLITFQDSCVHFCAFDNLSLFCDIDITIMHKILTYLWYNLSKGGKQRHN